MKQSVIAALLATALFACPAQSFASAAITMQAGSKIVEITGDDIHQLQTAMHTALATDAIKVHVTLKKASEMPAYAPDWYYAGLSSDSAAADRPQINVWIRADLKGSDQQHAIEESIMLGLMDGNYAGAGMKEAYDLYANLDANLGANAANPVLNRQKLAVALQKALYP